MNKSPKSIDASSMAKMFSQMAEFLNGMKESKERLSEEFEAIMKIKAT